MKFLNYIYTLLIAVLLGFFSFACSDDDVEQTEAEKPAEEYSGEPITTTVKVCVVAPDVSVDVDTRAGGDKANIEYEQPENGGRFQNIVVVVTDNSDKVYAIHCNKWYNNSNPTSAGMKQYEVIFPDLKITDTRGKVYALGNVSTDVYETISGYTVSGTTALSTTYMPEVYNLIKTTISADEANLHKLSFTPKKGNFKVGDQPVTTTCSGMPVNAMATATIQKGATIFNVHMRRVCARLQVTFRNFTGQYIDYDSGDSKDNNVYVDNFVLKKVLLNSSKYFYNGSAPSTAGSVDFNILTALGGSNNHNINKIENGKELVASMYVFENIKRTNSTDYQYNLKVDRGKSLGLNTTTIDPENAYVIWNRLNSRSIGYINKVCASRLQTEYDNIPFSDQVFWQLERDGSVDKAYLLKRRQLNVENDLLLSSNVSSYLKKVDDPDWDSDKYKEIKGELTTTKNNAQYIQILQNGSKNEFTMSLLGSSSIDYWSYHRYILINRKVYSMLTINGDKLVNRSSEYVLFGSQQLDNYEWTIYAKYIIKTNQNLNITQIERNHSYELDFSVMPNYDTKQELLVKCVRRQNDVDWSETQK